MTVYGLNSDELTQMHVENERAISKLQDQVYREQLLYELRMEKIEHAQRQMNGKAAGNFALRTDFENYVEETDEHLSNQRDMNANLMEIVTQQSKLIEKLTGRLETLEVGED